MQIFLLEININPKVTKFSGEYQGVHGIATKTGNAFCDDGIDLPGTAIIYQSEKVSAVSCSGAGCASICIYVHQYGIGILFYQLGVITDLRYEAVVLFFGLCRNTAVCGDPPFRWTLRRLRPWMYHRYVSVAV